ncbi:PhzF family phenazine biosynthesis protein [Shewanella benthica]|uniref:PhzF family phenazine biosynthesis protein n=1 Tax=Shewanella benthica TaxID=43661 RepID=UPI00187AFB61|nr:PhzF family phenazine biosynthesis protein [Shewanella benthica]MBE7216022.1 PhzF family phenazine biosynthesis protein [Shewanella benthica]MCL1063716.1 PhzF family phenazine biosynthesis protein [Shewanella benthica]
MKSYPYYICDVFTDKRFGGNQLAVLPDAQGLTSEQMQQIAREFNFPESTFVFPAERGNTRKVRIFTPSTEVPFAGHPNVGTAFLLAKTGLLDRQELQTIIFEEKAGLVPISIAPQADGAIFCELKAPEVVSLGQSIDASLVAEALSLNLDDIQLSTHQPIVASVGLPFLIVELMSLDALASARAKLDAFEKIRAIGVTPDIHLYVKRDEASKAEPQFDIQARMFAPFDGVPEDPATGSANCALAGLLAHYSSLQEGMLCWTIAQGVEMGRPSVLKARALKKAGQVIDTWIGGNSVLVSKGELYLD